MRTPDSPKLCIMSYRFVSNLFLEVLCGSCSSLVVVCRFVFVLSSHSGNRLPASPISLSLSPNLPSQEQNQVAVNNDESSSALLGINNAILPTLVCHFAAQGNIDELASIFNKQWEEGISPDMADYDGRTGLHLAAANGRIAAIRLFLDLGANMDAKDNMDRTPLREAVERGHNDVVVFLRGKGASLGMPDGPAASILCSLAREGGKEALERWILGGIDVNSKDYDSRTALHVAAASGRRDIVDLLVSNGADKNAVDRWGNKAFHG